MQSLVQEGEVVRDTDSGAACAGSGRRSCRRRAVELREERVEVLAGGDLLGDLTTSSRSLLLASTSRIAVLLLGDAVLAHQRGDVAERACAPGSPAPAAGTAPGCHRRSPGRTVPGSARRSPAGASARSGRCGRCAARCGSGSTGCRSGSGDGTARAGSRPRRRRRRSPAPGSGEVSSLKLSTISCCSTSAGRRAASRRCPAFSADGLGQVVAQPGQRGDPLGEHHRPRRRSLADADVLEPLDQSARTCPA